MKKILILLSFLSLFIISCCAHRDDNRHIHEETAAGQIEKHTSSDVHNHGIETDTLKPGPIRSIFKTGGVVMAGNKNTVLITSKSAGIIRFSSPVVYPGSGVKKGQILFTISGGSLTEDNPILRIEQLRSDLARARENYERAQRLLPEKIITTENFLSARNEYEKLLLEYENISRTLSDNELLTVAPADGFVREVFVKEGQKVSSGETVASLQTTGSMVLKALVPPDKINIIPSVKGAWFRVSGSDILYKTEELNGRIISYGKSIGENSLLIPLLFGIDFIPGIAEGQYAEVFLRGEELKDAITVPDRAIMEEYGRYYVFVKDSDGGFAKRYFTKGQGDGERTIVTEGLKAGEIIVSEGAYQVKLIQMQGSVPAHVHNH
mgnify:CR=1 FL=1